MGNSLCVVSLTYQQQHTPALFDRSTAAQEAQDEQHSTHCDEEVSHVQHLPQLTWSSLYILQKTQDRPTVHLHPDPHTQNSCSCQLHNKNTNRFDLSMCHWYSYQHPKMYLDHYSVTVEKADKIFIVSAAEVCF